MREAARWSLYPVRAADRGHGGARPDACGAWGVSVITNLPPGTNIPAAIATLAATGITVVGSTEAACVTAINAAVATAVKAEMVADPTALGYAGQLPPVVVDRMNNPRASASAGASRLAVAVKPFTVPSFGTLDQLLTNASVGGLVVAHILANPIIYDQFFVANGTRNDAGIAAALNLATSLPVVAAARSATVLGPIPFSGGLVGVADVVSARAQGAP